MVVVAIVALDLGALRALLNLKYPLNAKSPAIVGLGALPMMNVLAICMVVAGSRRGASALMRCILASGAVSLALYVAVALLFDELLLMRYLYVGMELALRTIRPYWPVVPVAVLYSIAIVMLALPQFAVALFAGLLSSRCGVTISRR
jgi:hypothetical protein